MEKINGHIVVNVVEYRGSKTRDNNGKASVMLIAQAGRMPNRNVLTGTVAENAGFVVGNTYLAQVIEKDEDKVYGRQFNFLALEELKGLDIIKTCKEIGPVELEHIAKPAGLDEVYQPKTERIIGAATRRRIDGLTIPSGAASTPSKNHKIVEGESIRNQRGADLTPADLEKALAKRGDKKEAFKGSE